MNESNNTLQQLLELQQPILKISTDKGFWENGTNRNKGEMVMLMITELSEAVESHRKNRRYDKEYNIVPHNQGDFFISVFERHCKDTLEDEIADTIIRLLDYCGGFNIQLSEREYRKSSIGNFAHDILRVSWYVLLAFEGYDKWLDTDTEEAWNRVHSGKDWSYALAAIIKLCEWYQIDIVQHCQWKMKYNSTRPYKHNKQY